LYGVDLKKILWVIPKNILPVNDGAKKANFSLLSSFCKLDVQIDLLIFNDFPINEAEYRQHFKINHFYTIKRTAYTSKLQKLLTLFWQLLKHPTLPITASFFAEKKVKDQIRKILSYHYEDIIFDGLHPYIGFKDFDLPNIVYRAHNVESDLWYTKASKSNNFFFQLILNWQGNKVFELENELINRSKIVWTIANEDQLKFKQASPVAKYFNVFVGLDFLSIYKQNTLTKKKFIFLGKLDWEPNKDGLIWFLKEIWPLVDKNKSELLIAGSGDVSALSSFLNQEGISFLGFIKNVDDIYKEADASIIPILYGSGTRIKVIESVSKEIPIISSSMGVQGSGLKDLHFFKASSNQDWVDIINNFDSNMAKIKSQSAFLELKSVYDSHEIALSALHSLK